VLPVLGSSDGNSIFSLSAYVVECSSSTSIPTGRLCPFCGREGDGYPFGTWLGVLLGPFTLGEGGNWPVENVDGFRIVLSLLLRREGREVIGSCGSSLSSARNDMLPTVVACLGYRVVSRRANYSLRTKKDNRRILLAFELINAQKCGPSTFL
jgi:hypothetical protein